MSSAAFPLYSMAYSVLSAVLIIRGPKQWDNYGVGEFCGFSCLISFIIFTIYFFSLIELLERRSKNQCISNFDLLCSL